MKDYFLSYAVEDEDWAEWIAWELDKLGYSVLMQRWSFPAGSNFAIEMHAAIKECRKLILVLSSHAIRSDFVTSEWSAFFAKDPIGSKRLLIPVRVDTCNPEGLLSQIVYIDLPNTVERVARERLLIGIGHVGPKPANNPVFPGIKESECAVGPQFPIRLTRLNPNPPWGALSNYPGDTDFDRYLEGLKTKQLPSIRKRSLGRAFIHRHLKSLLVHYNRVDAQLTVISIDVDGMGSINAKYGVDAGDMVMDRLFDFSEKVSRRLLVGRMGDDTLFILQREKTLDQALQTARRLVRKVATENWNTIASGMFVHCSAGVAEFSKSENALHTVLRALEGQRLARQQFGGNTVRIAPTNLKEPVRGRAWYVYSLPDS